MWRRGDDEALLDMVTAANVACGFHAGDPRTMRAVCAAAVDRGVSIGAHVGYRDLAGFGRRFLDVDPAELVDDLLYQLGALSAIASAAGGAVDYVKPHGALYHAIATDDAQAAAVVDAVRRFAPTLPLLGPPGSRLFAHAREAGLATVPEAYADRAYGPDGRLLSRRIPGAVIADADLIARQCVRIATEGEVVAVDGTVVGMRARSVCVHSDTPGAIANAAAARAALRAAGVELRSFA